MSEIGTATVKVKLDWSGVASDLRALADMIDPSLVHACPETGTSVTACCGRSPLDLPRTDRLSIYPASVTCRGRSDA